MGNRSDEINTVLCPASAKHCRQTEASIVPFDDGRLFLAYTDYYDGDFHDGGPARIMAKWSEDEGENWSAPFLVQDNIGKLNVMEANLLRLPSGRVLLSFLQKDSEGYGDTAGGLLHAMLIHSDDECRTWSDISQITEGDAYWCGTNDRFVRLSTGRILLPIGEFHSGCHVWLSDDDGATWRKGKQGLHPPEGQRYAEPTVVELADGTVAMFIRTDLGRIHIAHSQDGGDTWVMHNEEGPCSTYSPCMVKRVPESDDLLLIWNNHHRRTNLSTAISRDHGETWSNFRILEEEEDWPLFRSHTYPTLAFLNDNAHITYWETHRHSQNQRLFHLVYRRLPISWFYEERNRRPCIYDPATDTLSATPDYGDE